MLDQWNCVVREVVVWAGGPGDYRTRVHTVHGLTDKFFLTPPQPKCYGAGSLAGPRRFWVDGDGGKFLFFVDDTGLWQLEVATGGLGRVLDKTWDIGGAGGAGVRLDDLESVQGVSYNNVLLVFKDGTRWTLAANEEPCADDFTSNRGGDCAIGCAWRADGLGSYVNRATGACVSCADARAATVCGVGERLAECTREAPAKCEACPLQGGGLLVSNTNRTKVYTKPGQCDEDEMQYTPPCPRGFYLGLDGRYCKACPDPLSTTVLAGATRVEQCKCKQGLVLSAELGRCIGEELYAYDIGACVSECNHPPNSTVTDSVRCKWACDLGLYHSREAGWLDKCQPCWRDPADTGRPATRGDDDSPRSCEYFPVGT